MTNTPLFFVEDRPDIGYCVLIHEPPEPGIEDVGTVIFLALSKEGATGFAERLNRAARYWADGIGLWQRWLKEHGDPWIEYVTVDCFFCGEEQPNHKEDCVYVAAKELLGK